MLQKIDISLNSITMYRLVLYILLALASISFLLSFLDKIPYDPLPLLFSLLLILTISFITNHIISRILKIPTNIESFIISALILFFLLPPPINSEHAIFIGASAFIAMTSKYLMAIKKKHIFNPAAFSILLIGYLGLYGPSWWAGDADIIPFVAVGGLLIVRKIRRFQMFFAFLAVALCVQLIFATSQGSDILNTIILALTSSPLLFFATIMLTEPLTTPPTRRLQIMYATIIGILYSFQASIGPIYSSPEFALVAGNIFSYIVSPKGKYFLILKDKIEEGKGIFSYIFTADKIPDFHPGQYIEWTAPLNIFNSDSRGNRRYFTIASSPTEDNLRLGVKFSEKGSKFKKFLEEMKKGEKLLAGQLAGDFTLPKSKNSKMVWVAGGIGVTPFRSMTKFLLDTTQKRDIVFFYAASNPEEFAFEDVFDQAVKKIGMKKINIVTHKQKGKNWKGLTGHITPDLIKNEVPDYVDRQYFLSGPNGMVHAYKDMLKKLGIKNTQIHTDYFPGF